jgi:dUTP pyrophosphatase
MIIEYATTEFGVRAPDRGNPSDAGLDIYANLKEAASIEPGQNKMISTGLKFGIPHGYMLQVCNRSSMGAKRSLVVGAHIIDSGYDGEVFIDLHNIGSETQSINNGDKIAQLILVPVVHFRARKTNPLNLYGGQHITISERGPGALGSTDKKALHPLNGVPGGGF